MSNLLEFIFRKVFISSKTVTDTSSEQARFWQKVLQNAITMQAVSTGGKIKITEK